MTAPVMPRHVYTYLGVMHSIYHANAGEGIPKHSHIFAHVTAVHAGRLIVRKEGKELSRTKDDTPMLLTADEWHELEAAEDGTVFENVSPVQK